MNNHRCIFVGVIAIALSVANNGRAEQKKHGDYKDHEEKITADLALNGVLPR